MWSWILRAIAAVVAAIGTGLLSLTVRTVREQAEHLLGFSFPVAIAVLAVMLILAGGLVAASPAARPSARR